jgi:hypothetical protein
VSAKITTEQAEAVKRMRAEQNLTRSGLAEAFYEQFGDALYSRELIPAVGYALISAAARHLGEDPHQKPWTAAHSAFVATASRH